MKQSEPNLVYRNVLETISKYDLINEDEHIVIGLSGGADSVCLFDVLCKLSKSKKLKLYPVHINHGLRDEAKEDEKFCISLCENRGIECKVFRFDCNEAAARLKLSTEEAGRNFRYDVFAKLADELQDSGVEKDKIKIAVAQNADDRAETVLFRLMRGTGIDGLVGILPVRNDGEGRKIIRPLLETYKADINAYCESEGLSPRIDKTNFEEIYNRNRIRLSLIPLIEKQYNPEFKEALNRLATSAQDDRRFMEKLACEELAKSTKSFSKDENKIVLSGICIRKLDVSIRRRVITQALRRIGMDSDMGFAHYKACENIVASKLPSASANLPNRYVICKEYDDISIFEDRRLGKENALLNISIRLATEDELKKEDISDRARRVATFDADKICSVYGENAMKLLRIRKRKAGDYMSFSFGRKKIQNIFVDKKIPRFDRDKIDIVAIGSEVLAYFLVDKNSLHDSGPGYMEISEKIKADKGTKKYIFVELAMPL